MVGWNHNILTYCEICKNCILFYIALSMCPFEFLFSNWLCSGMGWKYAWSKQAKNSTWKFLTQCFIKSKTNEWTDFFTMSLKLNFITFKIWFRSRQFSSSNSQECHIFQKITNHWHWLVLNFDFTFLQTVCLTHFNNLKSLRYLKSCWSRNFHHLKENRYSLWRNFDLIM